MREQATHPLPSPHPRMHVGMGVLETSSRTGEESEDLETSAQQRGGQAKVSLQRIYQIVPPLNF